MEQDFKLFQDIPYQRPDFSQIKKDLCKYIKQMKNAPSYEEFLSLYKKVEENIIEIHTASTLANTRSKCDMTNEFYQKEVQVLNKKEATLSLTMLSLINTILSSPFQTEIERDFGSLLIKDLQTKKKLISPKNILLGIKEGSLKQQYSKTAALCKTTFRGEECNFYGLLKHMQSTDRTERKEAFECWAKLYESVSDKLDSLYTNLVNIRVKMAKNLGFSSYTDMAYLNHGRYDYTKEDIETFRSNVKKYIVPICQKLYQKQAKELGVKKLKFYDEELTFKSGNAIPIGTKDELVERAKEMYHQISKETGEYFDYMVDHQLFDLDTRAGKHLGGFCTCFAKYKAPFIFSNFNGTSADVDVLTHEAGHGFEVYEASRVVPCILQTSSTSEINEIHSMAMEQFAYPYMKSFFGENSDKYLYHHLVNTIECIPYLVCVDEFQHRVFENPKMTAKERRNTWKAIEQTYMPWRDYDGNEFLEGGGFWMQKQHIFLYPFYYIDYALAQVAAYQLFILDQTDHPKAWEQYLKLCKAGGTKGYFELLDYASLLNPLKGDTVKNVSKEIEKLISVFEEKLNS